MPRIRYARRNASIASEPSQRADPATIHAHRPQRRAYPLPAVAPFGLVAVARPGSPSPRPQLAPNHTAPWQSLVRRAGAARSVRTVRLGDPARGLVAGGLAASNTALLHRRQVRNQASFAFTLQGAPVFFFPSALKVFFSGWRNNQCPLSNEGSSSARETQLRRSDGETGHRVHPLQPLPPVCF